MSQEKFIAKQNDQIEDEDQQEMDELIVQKSSKKEKVLNGLEKIAMLEQLDLEKRKHSKNRNNKMQQNLLYSTSNFTLQNSATNPI